jgi:hypothetical protein
MRVLSEEPSQKDDERTFLRQANVEDCAPESVHEFGSIIAEHAEMIEVTRRFDTRYILERTYASRFYINEPRRCRFRIFQY